MKIIRRDPFREIERFFDDDFVNWGFGLVPAARRAMEPSLDAYQTEKDFIVELQVPKSLAEKAKVSVEDGILKIEAAEEEEKEENDKHYFRREIRRGSFSRMLSIPVPVKEDEARATFENGVLKVAIPKTEVKKPTEVKVEVK